jgi:predicted peptidase
MEVVNDLPAGHWPALSARYLVFLPAEYASRYTPSEYALGDVTWPLILFLHGAGERGEDLEIVKQQGLAERLAEGEDLPFIVVAPQCLPEQNWQPESLGRLLDLVERSYRVDRDRIYVTGMSMGGRGTWSTAMAFPNRFAAIAPICGRGEPDAAKGIAHLPVWAFHGALDPLVPLNRSREMVEALRSCGGDAKLTVYEDADHDSWTRAYAEPDLYTWMLSKRRGSQQNVTR